MIGRHTGRLPKMRPWIEVFQFVRGLLCSKQSKRQGYVYNEIYLASAYSNIETKSIPSRISHYTDVIMSAMASQITGVSIVYPTVCPGADQRKHQNSASLAFVRGIVNSPQKGPVTRKMFPFDDVILNKTLNCEIINTKGL